MKQILIIEDDPWQAEHTASLLEPAGYKVRHAADAIEAINTLDTSIVDLLVLDVFLPGPNAFTLLHELQSHRDLAKIPVVIFSTQSDYGLDTLKPYGVVDVVSKVSSARDELVSAVTKALS